jgi:hypothetical protein
MNIRTRGVQAGSRIREMRRMARHYSRVKLGGRISTLFLTKSQTGSNYNRHARMVKTRALGASLSPQRGEIFPKKFAH